MPPRSSLPGPRKECPPGYLFCSSCMTYKPSAEFAAHASRPNKKQSWCRRCFSSYSTSALAYRKEREILPEPRGKKNKRRAKRHVHWFPTLFKTSTNGRHITPERRTIILIFILFSPLSLTEIAWRCGVSRYTVSRLWKPLRGMKKSRNFYHSKTLNSPGKLPRRMGEKKALEKLRQISDIPKATIKNFLGLGKRPTQ